MLDRILRISPLIEVWVKFFYHRSKVMRMILLRSNRSFRVSKNNLFKDQKFSDFLLIEKTLSELGVPRGGILIVNSSLSPFHFLDMRPKEICNALLKFIGPHGTLAMPAIPYEKKISKSDNPRNEIFFFDTRRSPPWTGNLPRALIGLPGAIRSRNPLNNLVALGRLAREMMEKNIDVSDSLPCGTNSSWKFCLDNDAWIVSFGVDTSHSLTAIHLIEDLRSREWPIPDWYVEKLYEIHDADFKCNIILRERKKKWAINFAERTLQNDLEKSGIIKKSIVHGLNIEVCRLRSVINFAANHDNPTYPYWFPISRKIW